MLLKQRTWLAVLPIAVFAGYSAFVLCTNHLIPFANTSHCDPWHFFGYFYLADRPELLAPDSRRLWRIPAFVIGYYVTKLIPNVGADYVYFLIQYVGTLWATYLAARRLFGVFPALIGATFLAFNAVFVGTLSVTYSGPAVLFNTIGIWLAVEALHAAKAKRAMLLIACGAAIGFAVHAHLAVIACSASVALYAVPWRQLRTRSGIRGAGQICINVAVGFVLATLATAAINWGLFNGRFWFFVDIPSFIAKVDTSDYLIQGWFFMACRGAIMLLAAIIPVFQVVRALSAKALSRVNNQDLSANLPLIVLVTMLIIGSWFGDLFFQYDYYYVAIIPFIAISIASVFSALDVSNPTRALLLAAYAGLAALSMLPTIETMAALSLSPDQGWCSLSIVALFSVALVVFGLSKDRRQAIVTSAIVLAILASLGLAIRPQRMGRFAWTRSYQIADGFGAPMYQRVRSAVRFLASHSFPSRPVFWISMDGLEESIGIARAFDYCAVEINLPKIDISEGIFERDFKPGNRIVLVDRDSRLVSLANTSLRPLGLVIDEEERTTIAYAGLTYSVVIGTIKSN